MHKFVAHNSNFEATESKITWLLLGGLTFDTTDILAWGTWQLTPSTDESIVTINENTNELMQWMFEVNYLKFVIFARPITSMYGIFTYI